MSITYEEALGTLEAMFVDNGWNREQLDTILRHEKGHMENTVDLILQHGTKDPTILIEQLDAGIDPNQSALALDEQLARQLSQASLIPPQRPTSSSQPPPAIGTYTVLPDDFLRIPNYRPPNQMSDDEALARMLQDELFTEELRRNPDFAHLAGGSRRATDQPQRSLRQAATNHANANTAPNPFAQFSNRFNSSSSNNNNNNNNNNILEKLSEMGEGAKRRLQIMAAQFQQAQAQATSRIMGANNNNQQQQATPSSERRSLLDDHDDMELAARKDL